MWTHASAIARYAATMWMMLESCIVCRVWSKFGKTRIRPVTTSTVENSTSTSQNTSFSPALNLPLGYSWPLK